MSYAIYKQFQIPTAVDFCIKAHVISENELNLVLSKGNLLQIYNIKRNKIINNEDIQNKKIANLELFLEKKLFGNIESLNAIRLKGKNRDSLIISFKEAKVNTLFKKKLYNDLFKKKIKDFHYRI